MTIAQVLYVLEIADCRSISAAAERQFISQSALSQQIQRLEGELGYPLFVRTPRGLTLTAAGETFCREARPVAEQWQRLCSAVKPDGRRGRRLRIGMGARVYSNRLFQDIARYFDSHPEIDVTFVTEAGLDVLAGLRDGSIDLALDRLPAGEEGGPQLTPLLMRLPEKERVPLELMYFENYPLEEIAAVLGVPRGTAASRLSRGRRRLKAIIEKEGL